MTVIAAAAADDEDDKDENDPETKALRVQVY
jgi:hypothetical protein